MKSKLQEGIACKIILRKNVRRRIGSISSMTSKLTIISRYSEIRSPSITSRISRSSNFSEELMTFELKSSNEDPWGCAADLDVHWTEWSLISVYPGKQMERLGLQTGDIFVAINGIDIDQNNYNLMRLKLLEGTPCRITFRMGNNRGRQRE